MGLRDALLARERHTLRSAESVETCRRLLGPDWRRSGPAGLGAGPFFVRWTDPDHARLQSVRARHGGVQRSLRVELASEGSGTVARATSQLAGSYLGPRCIALVLFGAIGYLSTSERLSLGRPLLSAMFPIGFAAPVVVIVSLVQVLRRGWKSDGIFRDLAFVLHAAAIDQTATPEHSSARADALWSSTVPSYGRRVSTPCVPGVPAPQLAAPAPWTTSSPLSPGVVPIAPIPVPMPARTRRSVIDWLLARRAVTLVTSLTAEDCRHRLGTGVDTRLPVTVDWSGSEFRMKRAWRGRGNNSELRARLVPHAPGTLIEATTGMFPYLLAWWGSIFLFGCTLVTGALVRFHSPSQILAMRTGIAFFVGGPLLLYGVNAYFSDSARTYLLKTLETIVGASELPAAADAVEDAQFRR